MAQIASSGAVNGTLPRPDLQYRPPLLRHIGLDQFQPSSACRICEKNKLLHRLHKPAEIDVPMHDKFILFRNDFTGENLFFTDAEQILTAWAPDEMEPVFAALEKAREQGNWAAGFVSYEAGYALEPALVKRIRPRAVNQRACPLMCFGVYAAPQAPDASLEILQQTNPGAGLAQWSPRWSFDEYRQRFDQLHSHLHAGDCFQANLTFDITAHCNNQAAELFNSLRGRQAVAHSALVSLDGPHIVSRSPELFFRVGRDRWIESRPMKGTAPRGKTMEQDRQLKQQLEQDPKCRSET